VARQGPFWDVMEGRADPPPAAELLGWKLVEVDPDEGTIEVSFTATDQFLNPAGTVQGGFLAAMLDDTLGPALVATLGNGEWAPTTDLHVQFVKPAPPVELRGRQDRAPRPRRRLPGRRAAGFGGRSGGDGDRDGRHPPVELS
jgi:uncharacterized protein (TIGR00369 family)